MKVRLHFISVLLVVPGLVSADIITTADGNGADTYIQKGNGDTNYGNATAVVIKDSGAGGTTRHGYLRFDLSTLTNPIIDATLQLRISANNEGGGGVTPQDHTVEVYGLTNQSLDNWVEGNGGTGDSPAGEIDWNNAPANNTADNSFTADASLLGNFFIASDPVGTIINFTDPNLVTFLNDDTNDLASILLRRVGGSGGHNLTFSSKENNIFNPTLDVTTIPEPSSLLMLTFGSIGLALFRRCRTKYSV